MSNTAEEVGKIIGTIIGVFIGFLIFITLLSFIPATLWYTFDDALATITGNPAWGEVSFWNVYGFTWFVILLMSGRSVVQSNS